MGNSDNRVYIRGICLVTQSDAYNPPLTQYKVISELKKHFKQVTRVPLKFLYEKDGVQIFFYLHIVNDINNARGFYDENILYNVTDIINNIYSLHKKLKEKYGK